MSDDFNRRYDEQTAMIREQLAVLDGVPQSLRQKFRVLELFCSRCDERIAEVLELRPYRVLRFRGEAENDESDVDRDAIRARIASEGLTGMKAAMQLARETRPRSFSIRRGEGSFTPLAWPRREHSNTTVLAHALCKCAAWDLHSDFVYDRLEDKTRRVVWHPQSKGYVV